MGELSDVQRFVVWVLPVLFGITVHEVAHGWVAKLLGDPTAQMLGRLSLNPIRHIDPVGTVLLPGLLMLIGGFVFGWAKPVPVTWDNLKRPKRDMALVAIAGPGANLIMALLWAVIAKIGSLLIAYFPWMGLPMVYMGAAGILINIVLMVLNLLPIPPLDGGSVLVGLLPARLAWHVGRIEPYGFIILIVLLVTEALSYILEGPVLFLHGAVSTLVGL